MVDHVALAYSEVVRALGDAKSGRRKLTRAEKKKLLWVLRELDANRAMLQED
jgi:hypothetical protein